VLHKFSFYITLHYIIGKRHLSTFENVDYFHNTGRKANKSPLPLTDPRDAVPYAHRVVHRYGLSV